MSLLAKGIESIWPKVSGAYELRWHRLGGPWTRLDIAVSHKCVCLKYNKKKCLLRNLPIGKMWWHPPSSSSQLTCNEWERIYSEMVEKNGKRTYGEEKTRGKNLWLFFLQIWQRLETAKSTILSKWWLDWIMQAACLITTSSPKQSMNCSTVAKYSRFFSYGSIFFLCTIWKTCSKYQIDFIS